ncbi:MAG: IspD/TarI family cytidylyltransferase [Planctomycetia bacterium]|nr:IspD/TarI family cytidylyltransferase [Planctomycetia bacterium]
MKNQFCVILPAAGRSTRFKGLRHKKQFTLLDDRAVWLHAVSPFLQMDEVKQVILVISPEDREDFGIRFQADAMILGITVVDGGKERCDSIKNAIPFIDPACDYVAVHDAVRPCITQERIREVFRVARHYHAACLAIPVRDTIKRVKGNAKGRSAEKIGSEARLTLENLIPDTNDLEVDSAADDGRILETLNRDGLWYMQTPQVFRRDLFEKVYTESDSTLSKTITDDATLFEKAGIPVYVVEGSSRNIKITTQEDLRLASAILKSLPQQKSKFSHPFADEDKFF